MKSLTAKKSSFSSILKTNSVISPEGNEKKALFHPTLLLTSLIDVFSILVIFLLVSFSTTEELLILSEAIELPSSLSYDELERAPVIRVEEARFYIEENEIPQEKITETLVKIRQGFSEEFPDATFPGMLTIQADRQLHYDLLNKIIVASSHAGFSDINFAVIAE